MKVRCATCKQFVDKNEAFRRFGVSSWCSEVCYRRQKVLKREPKTMAVVGRKQPSPRKNSSSIPNSVRREVFERDRGRCRRCSSTERLHCHHINFKSEGVDHSVHNLIVLCDRCHKLVHADKLYYKPILLGLIWLYYVEGDEVDFLEFECGSERLPTPTKEFPRTPRQAIRRLVYGELPPSTKPYRYKIPTGYMVLRWPLGDGTYVEILEHRYVTNAPPGTVVHHKDGNKTNNSIENLEVLSPSVHAKMVSFDVGLAAEAYESGMTTTEVGRLFGVHASVISRRLRAYGVRMRSIGREKLEIDTDELLDLYYKGMRPEAIAAHFGCSSTPIRQRLKELGVNPHLPGRPRRL